MSKLSILMSEERARADAFTAAEFRKRIQSQLQNLSGAHQGPRDKAAGSCEAPPADILDADRCPDCDGRGQIRVQELANRHTRPMLVICEDCDGTGLRQ